MAGTQPTFCRLDASSQRSGGGCQRSRWIGRRGPHGSSGDAATGTSGLDTGVERKDDDEDLDTGKQEDAVSLLRSGAAGLNSGWSSVLEE